MSLGLGYECVARADQHVDRSNRFRSQCHGADCLDATKAINLICACKVHCRNDCIIRSAGVGRGTGNYALYASYLGGQHTHVCAGDHWVFATRNVTADAVYRDVLVAQRDTRESFDFNIAK